MLLCTLVACVFIANTENDKDFYRMQYTPDIPRVVERSGPDDADYPNCPITSSANSSIPSKSG